MIRGPEPRSLTSRLVRDSIPVFAFTVARFNNSRWMHQLPMSGATMRQQKVGVKARYCGKLARHLPNPISTGIRC